MEDKSFKIKPCFIGALCSVVVIIVLTLLLAVTANMSSVTENTVKIVSYIVLAVSGVCGGIIAGKGTQRRGVITGATVGVVLLLVIKILEFTTTGKITFNDGFYISSLSLFISSVIGGVVGVN